MGRSIEKKDRMVILHWKNGWFLLENGTSEFDGVDILSFHVLEKYVHLFPDWEFWSN